MPNITLVVSEELRRDMEKHPSIKWSSAVRNIIEQKLADFEELEKLAEKSKFTMKDWKFVEKRVSKSMARHAKALLDESNS
jgi:tRNA C32,U32 (ribose-2'-O)-methylase TrmJ